MLNAEGLQDTEYLTTAKKYDCWLSLRTGAQGSAKVFSTITLTRTSADLQTLMLYDALSFNHLSSLHEHLVYKAGNKKHCHQYLLQNSGPSLNEVKFYLIDYTKPPSRPSSSCPPSVALTLSTFFVWRCLICHSLCRIVVGTKLRLLVRSFPQDLKDSP